MGEAHDFLSTLLAGAPDDLYAYLWALSPDGETKETHWFPISDGPDPIADRAMALAENFNVYFGVSASTEDRGPRNRISNATSAGIYGLWADIDWADPNAHKKMNLPPDREAAMSILDAVGLAPTMLVDSGHGLHAWWVFSEFARFESDEDRLRAADLAYQWFHTIKSRAADLGFIVDSVFDLARVLRVPGTINHKHGRAPTSLLDNHHGRLFDSSGEDMLPFVVKAPDTPYTGANAYVVGDIVLDPNAVMPTQAHVMRVNDEVFGKTLDWKRREFNDDASAYDMSLATIAAGAGWDDQTITDMLIANRRAHGKDLKLRIDYYKRTISRARQGAAAVAALDGVDEACDLLDEAKATGDDEEVKSKRRSLNDSLADSLTTPSFTGMIRYNGDTPTYAMLFGLTEVFIGPMSILSQQQKVRDIILSSEVAVQIPVFKTADWRKVVYTMRIAAEDREIGPEASDAGALESWLAEYLSVYVSVPDVNEAVSSGFPYNDGTGRLVIFLPSLRKWINTSYHERISARDLGRVLRSLGAEPTVTRAKLKGHWTTRSAWVLPDRLAPQSTS